MATGFQTTRRNFLRFFLLSGVVLCFGSASKTAEKEKRMGIILSGAFDDAEISQLPTGGKNTKFSASYEWDYGVRPFTEKTWKEHNLDWDAFFPIALAVADDIAETVDFRIVRDSRGVIEYAVLEGDDPFLSSAILSQKLLDRLREKLGDRIHAIPVDRQRVYLLPATGGDLETFGPAIVKEFRRATLPISLEVFLLTDDGVSVIGELERE